MTLGDCKKYPHSIEVNNSYRCEISHLRVVTKTSSPCMNFFTSKHPQLLSCICTVFHHMELQNLMERASSETSDYEEPQTSPPKTFWKLLDGPENPRDDPPQITHHYIKQFEYIPSRIAKDFPLKIRAPILAVYLFLWFLIFRQVALGYLRDPPSADISSFSCRASLWKGKNDACGTSAHLCLQEKGSEVTFRCPALCDRDSWTYSSIPVGSSSIKYRGFFVGGGSSTESQFLSHPYRADSFLCGAAMHAGIISPWLGGCAKIKYTGAQTNFPSSEGPYGPSIPFDSFFPSSFAFEQIEGHITNCRDPRVPLVAINILLGIPVMYFCSGAVAFIVVTLSGFWSIVLSFDPPVAVDPWHRESLAALVSLSLERFLPMCFMLYVLWRFAVRITLSDPKDNVQPSPLSKTLIWYPLYWVGVLNNVTFDRLPMDRLTIKDLREQPGAITTIVCVVATIVTCALVQAFKIWQAGKFKKYLLLYATFIVAIIVLASLDGLTLRIHHYILALLLIPGTATRGFSAMLFQGVLLGLFINGVARWGLASIDETRMALLRDDPSGDIPTPHFIGFDNNTLSWNSTGTDAEYSLLVNDIEQYRGNQTSVDLVGLLDGEMPEIVTQDGKENGNVTLYVRVAQLERGTRGDYTRAGVISLPYGSWTEPEEGLT